MWLDSGDDRNAIRSGMSSGFKDMMPRPASPHARQSGRIAAPLARQGRLEALCSLRATPASTRRARQFALSRGWRSWLSWFGQRA